MNANLGELDTLRALAARLDDAPHGGRAALVAEAAELLRISRQEVYRRLRKIGWSSGRKPRADKGRISVPEDVARTAAHLVYVATRANGKQTVSITGSLDILRGNGEELADPETGEVTTLPKSAATLSRAMRRYGCHPKQLAQGRPHVHMRSLHPNHVWQIDASACVLFYLPKGQVAMMDEKAFYKNKPANLARAERERVWRYVITDHYSGAVYVHYVQAAGESSLDLTEAFLRAITLRDLDDPMHGVPLILIMDKGAANTSHLFLNLLDRLGVKYITHAVGNSRAKGQVECMQNVVECQFEGRLAFYRVAGLADLQDAADRWRKHFNAHMRHSRHGQSRNAAWLSIAEEQLRLAPTMALCRDLVNTRPKEAKVRDDMTISHKVKGYDRQDYDLRLIPGLVPSVKVMVVVNAYRAPAVDVIVDDPVEGEMIWTVEPVKKDDAGFWESAPVFGQEHKALPDTVADKRVKEIAEAAGPDRKSARAPEGVDVFADVKDAPVYVPRRGRDLGLDASRREIMPLTIVDAAMALKARLGDAWNPREHFAWLKQRYSETVPADEIESIAARLAAPEPKAGAILRVVGGDHA